MPALRTLEDLLLADLARAQNLVRKVHPDPIDPQFRIGTPNGDWWIALPLTEDSEERARRLSLVSDFMATKLAVGFTLAAELHEPDSVYVAGVLHRQQKAVLSGIVRRPLGFLPPRWLSETEVGRDVFDLLPRGARAIAAQRATELTKWFGREGRFPVLPLSPEGTILCRN